MTEVSDHVLDSVYTVIEVDSQPKFSKENEYERIFVQLIKHQIVNVVARVAAVKEVIFNVFVSAVGSVVSIFMFILSSSSVSAPCENIAFSTVLQQSLQSLRDDLVLEAQHRTGGQSTQIPAI